jgi:3-oxoadipate enol-lactonase
MTAADRDEPTLSGRAGYGAVFAQRLEGTPLPDADLGSRHLHYTRRGSGAPLLLIQGMAGHHRIWGEAFLTRMAADFDVVAYDHRGIGESTDVAGPFTITELADDATALLDTLGWADAHVMGVSLGGMVAQELAIGRPARIRSLVLGCSYAGGAGASLAAPGPMRMIEAMNSGAIDVAIRTAYEVNLAPGFRADETRYEPFKTASLGVRVPVPTVLRQAQAAYVHDTSARLAQISAPTLVVHGSADEMLLADNSAHIARLIPGARLATLDGVGHLFWWERPDATADLVRAHCLGG